MKTAIAFSTKERLELSRRSVVPLLRPKQFDLFWIDGSSSFEGKNLFNEFARGDCPIHVRSDVKGGADAAIIYSLTTLLQHKNNYTHVGLVENDVLLDDDWFEPTMALFEQGKKDGLEVGAVSARCYEDRIFIQRDDYAVMHNLGAGMIIFTRKAAEIVLRYARTGHTLENRRAFMMMSGLDIGRTSVFCRDDHITCMDWQFERCLVQHGLAAVALTPAKCQMIGQVPSLEEQGLKLLTAPIDGLRNDKAFADFVERTKYIRDGLVALPITLALRQDDGSETYLAHQIQFLGGVYEGDWKLRWSQGFGPFAWVSDERNAKVKIPISGACTVLLSGGKEGGGVRIIDTESGFNTTIPLAPEGQIYSFQVPGGVTYRNVIVEAMSSGICFFGVATRDPQPNVLDVSFDHSMLPPV